MLKFDLTNSESDVQDLLKEMSSDGDVDVTKKDFVKYLKPYLKKVDCVKMENGQYTIEWTVTSQSEKSQQSGKETDSSKSVNSESTMQTGTSESTNSQTEAIQTTSQQTENTQSSTEETGSSQTSSQTTSQTTDSTKPKGKSSVL